MLNRLNGWQRIGVVLSLLWFVFLVISASHEYFSSARYPLFIEVTRVDLPAPSNDSASTQDKKTTFTLDELYGYSEHRRLKIGLFLLALIAPVTAAWSISYLLVYVVRWVLAGFRQRGA